MTKDDIILTARYAGFKMDCDDLWWGTKEALIKTANLIAEREREECAKLADSYWEGISVNTAATIAEAIRARGK